MNVDRLVTDVVSIIKPLANKQECTIAMDIQNDLPRINADKKLIEEALINLLINSLEAMPVHGQITVSATRGEGDTDIPIGPCIRIDITDTGQGIAAEHSDLIFDPFFTTKAAGTGLGLPMVLNTINRHGGEIQVRRRQAGGTVFSLFLPIPSPEPETYGKNTTH